MIVPSVFVSGIATLGLALIDSTFGFFLAMGLLGIGTGIAGPAPAAYAADLAKGQNYGATLGMFRTTSDLGFVLGPILLGWIADMQSLIFALYVNAGVLFLAGIVFGLLASETRGSSSDNKETDDSTDNQPARPRPSPGRSDD